MSATGRVPLRGGELRDALSNGALTIDALYESLGLASGQGWLAELLDDSRPPTTAELARLSVHARVPMAVLAGMTRPAQSLAVALRSGLLDAPIDIEPAIARAQKLIEQLRLLVSWYPGDAAGRIKSATLARRARSSLGYVKLAAQMTAQNLRAVFGIDDTAPIGDLTSFVECLGVPVTLTNLPPKVHGLTAHEGVGDDWYGVILVSTKDWWTRQRYTLAHELGHVLFLDDQPIIIDREGDVSELDQVEWRAECFARYFLAPDEAVRTFWARHGREGKEVALARFILHFGISRPAAIRALVEVTELRYRDFEHLSTGSISVSDLMASAGLAEQWREACAHQVEEGASPWLLSMALAAYRHELVPTGVVADVLGRSDTAEVEWELNTQGWKSVAHS